MKVLITGSAGFIGAALTLRLLERGDEVIGFDNLNDYYAVSYTHLDVYKRQRLEKYETQQQHPHEGNNERQAKLAPAQVKIGKQIVNACHHEQAQQKADAHP